MTRSASGILCAFFVFSAAPLCMAGAAQSAASPDWNAVAAVDTVEVITKDEDGTPRDTTIWLVVVDDTGYIRTGGTHWWSNIERDHDMLLHVEGKEYPMRAALVENVALCQRVQDAFHAKYGFGDRVVGFFFRSVPHIMRLDPRGA